LEHRGDAVRRSTSRAARRLAGKQGIGQFRADIGRKRRSVYRARRG